MKEPPIHIHGELLSQGQAMTVRVALEAFASSLSTGGLGDDENGKRMTEAYLGSIASIRRLMGANHSSTTGEKS